MSVIRREITVGLAVAALLLGTPPGEAAAQEGTFQLVQCDPLHNGVEEAMRSDAGAYEINVRCNASGPDRGIHLSTVAAAHNGRAARVRWVAPADMSIVGVRLEAKIRTHNGHRARIYMADGSMKQTKRIASGAIGPTSWQSYSWQTSGAGDRQFVAELICNDASGCPRSDHAKTWIRNIRLTVVDHVPPTIQVSGDLFADGWKRGQSTFWLESTDVGTGLSAVVVSANGSPIENRTLVCSSAGESRIAYQWHPCRSTTDQPVTVVTDEAPWIDGANSLRLCVHDFAGNRRCVERDVKIDNTPPQLSFPNSLNPRDPDLIEVAAKDLHSGLATGAISTRLVGSAEWLPVPTIVGSSSLSARVSSSSFEPGEYEFLARASDVAGNMSTTTLRADGAPMILAFPLRAGVRLDAQLSPGGSHQQTLRYGQSASVEGRLLDLDGRPLPNREIIVDENFGLGALIEHRVRRVRTDAKGRWSSRLPAGPSRTVTVAFAGDAEYLPATASGGRISVKTGTRLQVSSRRVPEGRAVQFRGRVGRAGARIPARGKLVQLQYFDPVQRRWFTVRNPFYTDSRGHYRTRYRFGKHYARDVRIRFRVRALPESDWPYRAAASRPRLVKVLAR